MKRAKKLAAEVRAYCDAHQDAKEAQRYTRFFNEGYDPWGTHKDHSMWAEKKQEWFEHYRVSGLDGFMEAGELLFASGKYEEGGMATRLLKRLRNDLDAGAARTVPARAALTSGRCPSPSTGC